MGTGDGGGMGACDGGGAGDVDGGGSGASDGGGAGVGDGGGAGDVDGGGVGMVDGGCDGEGEGRGGGSTGSPALSGGRAGLSASCTLRAPQSEQSCPIGHTLYTSMPVAISGPPSSQKPSCMWRGGLCQSKEEAAAA